MPPVHTAVLLAEPDLSPAWKLVFRIFTDAIRVVITLRGKLATDFRFNQVPHFWLADLQDYNKLLGDRRAIMDETLEKLNLVAPETWDAGHQIRNAVGSVCTALFGAGMIRDNNPLAPDVRHNRIMDIRRRVFEASKSFSERPLIEDFRRAVTLERKIALDVAWLKAGETNGEHYGIVVPGASDESPADIIRPTVAKSRMTVKEANEKAMQLARKMRKGFFAFSERQQAEEIGCSWATWKKTPFYAEAQRKRPAGNPKKPSSPKTESLTAEREAVTGEGDRDEVLKQLAAEQAADNEPSPLENDPPNRPRKIHSRKRL